MRRPPGPRISVAKFETPLLPNIPGRLRSRWSELSQIFRSDYSQTNIGTQVGQADQSYARLSQTRPRSRLEDQKIKIWKLVYRSTLWDRRTA